MIAELSALVFSASFLGAYSTRKWWIGTGDPVEERLQRLVRMEAAVKPELLMIPSKESGTMRRLRERLLLAGLHRRSDFEKAKRFGRFCKLVPFALTITLHFMGFPLKQVVAAGFLFGVIFILVPRFWMIRNIMRRRREIERNLPDTLDLLILCLEAGLSFDSSLVRVANEQRRVSSHISRELTFTNQEILTGKSREEALKNLAWRTGVEEMKSFVGAVLQSIKLGTSLTKTLRTQAEAMRKSRREKVRAAIMKTPVKLIFPLILFIFPTLLVVILAPSLVDIFRHLGSRGMP